jgi:DNA-directed RNA polymerase specialized sigma24 family protein
MKNQERQDYFEAVYRETFKRLSQFVFFKVAEPSEAEDVIASVYMDFYRYVVLRGKHPENILAYLMKMANHELSRHYKNNPHQISFDDEQFNLAETIQDDRALDANGFDQMDSDILWRAVQRLSPAEQQVVVAKFRFDLTFTEIAASLAQSIRKFKPASRLAWMTKQLTTRPRLRSSKLTCERRI